MRFLKRAAAILAGILAFFAVMGLSPLAINGWSRAFTVTEFPGGEPSPSFVVVLRDLDKSGNAALTASYWRRVPDLRASGRKFSYLLLDRSGDVPAAGDHYWYEVTEDRKTSQVIEVKYLNTHASWSRYEAHADRIVPLSYRTDGGFLVLIPLLALLVAAFFIGRRVTRWVRVRLGVG